MSYGPRFDTYHGDKPGNVREQWVYDRDLLPNRTELGFHIYGLISADVQPLVVLQSDSAQLFKHEE